MTTPMTTTTTSGTMTEVAATTIRVALKYLYRAIPAGAEEQKELYRAIERLEKALVKK